MTHQTTYNMTTNTNIILDTATGYSLSNLASLPRSKKLHIIAFLSNSMLETSEDSADDDVLDKLCGSWADDGISADELIEVCESGRNINREIVEL